ncbi:retrotransposon protein, putative, ty1-copia subclass [Tanacetum coccineum]
MTTSSANNSVFRGFFEKQKLTGPNFIDWYRQLRIVLSIEDKLNYLEQPLPPAPVAPAGQHVAPEILAAHTAWVKGSKEIAGLMLMTMEPEIQRNLENLHANDMLKELKALFAQQAEQELLQTTRDFHACKQEEGQSVSSYVLRMKGYIDNLERLGHPVTLGLAVYKGSRKLKSGALSLYVGNGQREAVEAICNFDLSLPSGLVIVLNNCHYAPSITRGVISVSRLYEDGFINRFVNNTIQVSRNNMVYFSAIPRDGIFEIDLSNSYANENSIYTVSNKRAKLDCDSASCVAIVVLDTQPRNALKRLNMMNFSIQLTLGILKNASLVCLERWQGNLTHIKWKGPKTYLDKYTPMGEYMSQEFLDHLKDHGIIAHRTPPYTPKHNGVLERRNKTLLDMVRSMMSQTTLPNSFWDYAFETAAPILNMVPTKKVEKTPYKVWHGQALKLSYLKIWGCKALVKRDTLTKPDKLEPMSIKCIFIGYPKETMGYSFYYPPENKVLISRNAEFLENNLITQEVKDDIEIDEPQSDIIPICRSIRTRRPTDRMCLYIDAEEHELGDLGKPANYKAALLDPESDK